MLYPMMMKLENRLCIVLGGGDVALRKTLRLVEAGAKVMVISPDAVPELQQLADEGEIVWRHEEYRHGLLGKSFLVVCATDDETVNWEASVEAKGKGILVNAPGQPQLSDFSVPAALQRGRLTLTVSTGDLSPALSRCLREKLEQEFPAAYGDWLERLAVIREEAKGRLGTSRQRTRFWRQALNQRVIDLVRDGNLEQAEAEVRNAIDGIGAESQDGPGRGAGTAGSFQGED